MAKKTAKQVKNRRTGNWSVKRSGKNITATHQTEDSDVSSVVNAAIQRMANECAPQVWFNSPQKPGLHLMRHANGDNTTYDVVRAVFKQNGVKDCCSIMSPREEHTYNMAEFTNPQFQKVQE